MKNLWMINHYAGTPKHGMVFRSYYVAKSLQEKEVKTTVFSSSHTHVMHTQPKVSKSFHKEMIDGIEYIWVKNIAYGKSKTVGRLLNMLYFSFKLFFYPFFLKEKPDAVLVSSPSPFPVINGWLWAKLTGAKFIFEVRDIWPLSMQELSGMSKWHPLVVLMRFFEVFAYKFCDYTVSLLPHADKHMVPSGLKESKFKYIPNGILENDIEVEDCGLDLPKDKFLIGYAGTIGIANKLQLLVEVAQKIDDKDVHICIVGKGAYKDELMAYCKDNSIDNVTFYDPIKKNQVPHFLGQLDACYIALQDEKLFSYGVSPNKLFDYMFAKKPILFCINSGNHPVRDGNCGYEVRTGKSEDIAAAVKKLKALSEDERVQMGENGYQYVLENHSYAKISDKFKELF